MIFPQLAARHRRTILDVLLAGPAVLILTGWLIIAIVHLDDRFEVGHGQGVWMALARHANESGLYPEIFDGTSYGGSRYMPLPILVHAGLARLTGEYLISGKLVGLVITGGMTVLLLALLRGLGCRWPWALALCALPLASFSGLRAGTTIGGDSLPVLLGLAALAVTVRSRRPMAVSVAAGLSALAIAAKLTAVWVPTAIVVTLLLIGRRRCATRFALYAIGATVVLVVALNLASDGRMVENLGVSWGAGVEGAAGFVKAPARVLDALVAGEQATWALLPVVASIAATGWRRDTSLVFPVGAAAAALVLIVVFADVGTGPNQLLDLTVLTTVSAGVVVAGARQPDVEAGALVTVVAAIVIWSGVTGLVVRVRPPLQRALSEVVTGDVRQPRDVLSDRLSADVSILSEDPGLLVHRDRQPVVIDPFMLRRLAETHPAEVRRLVRRVERQEFDLVVLVVELRDPRDSWWREYHFGTEVMVALDRAYELDERVGPYFLYRPRP